MKSHSIYLSALMIGGLFCSPSAQALDYWDFVTVQSSRENDSDPSTFKVGILNSTTGQHSTLSTKIFGHDKEGNAIQGVAELKYSAATNKIHFGTERASYYYDLSNRIWGKSDMILNGWTNYNHTKYATQHLAIGDGTGEVHIGEHSLITVEENGIQKLYAKDAEGNAIPINITEGSKLLIDGVEVTPGDSEQVETNRKNISTNAGNIETNRKNISTSAGNIETNRKNINDLGYGVAGATALTAALSSLPIAAEDAPFSCGVGTGGYSSRFAVGLGCAARLNERLSVNVGGSHVFGGSSDYGDGSLGTVAARAGVVFKLGTIHKSSSINEEELQSRLDEMEEKNEESIARLKKENRELLVRLQRLESIALGHEATVTELSLK